MITLTLDTWVSLAVVVTGLATLYGALHRDIRRVEERLDRKIDGVDLRVNTKIDTKIDGLREELRTDIARLDGRIASLDDRVYALAAGLRPVLEQGQRAD